MGRLRGERVGSDYNQPFSADRRRELAGELSIPTDYAENEDPYFLVLLCGLWGGLEQQAEGGSRE